MERKGGNGGDMRGNKGGGWMIEKAEGWAEIAI